MRAVVVYESLFGNTRRIAEAVAAGIEDGDPGAVVELDPVSAARPEDVRTADLLVVGGPTHMHGMTSAVSRRMGVKGEQKSAAKAGTAVAVEPGVEGPGLRDWLPTLSAPDPGSRAAAFDTRAASRMAGGAAHGISRRLRRLGYELASPPEGFVIEDTQGPLREGELERARQWAAALVRTTGVRT